MASSRLKILASLSILAVFLVIYVFPDPESPHPPEVNRDQGDRSDRKPYELSGVKGQIVMIERTMRDRHYEKALRLAEEIAPDVLTDPDLERGWIARFLEAKGDVHTYLWHFIEAREAYQQATDYADRVQTARLSRKIDQTDKVVDKLGGEREQQQAYHVMRNAGPAQALQGKVAVIYLFVKLKQTGQWGLKDRETALRSWSNAKQWLQKRAEDYRKDVTFAERLFIVDRSPLLQRMTIKDDAEARKKASKILQIAMKELGRSSVLAFLEQIKEETAADQAILLVHINDRKRSFAYCCVGSCNTYYGEFAFILEEPASRRWQKLEYTMAHEATHLFGADDLYNIGPARSYIPRDIMNYPSRYLSTSTLEGITAYAVGLLDTIPSTPFEVTEN